MAAVVNSCNVTILGPPSAVQEAVKALQGAYAFNCLDVQVITADPELVARWLEGQDISDLGDVKDIQRIGSVIIIDVGAL